MSRLRPAALVTLLLLALQMGFSATALAAGDDFSLDFIAAAPDTYDHSTGLGGEYDERNIPEAVVESLEGGDFFCGDIVEFFTAVTVDEDAEGIQSISIDYSFDSVPTGGGPVGYEDIVFAIWNEGDSGNLNLNGNETVVLTAEGSTEEEVTGTVAVGGLEASEQVIVAIGVRLGCSGDPEEAHGNLFGQIDSAETSEGDPINVGEQTVPLMVQGLQEQPPVPGIAVTKECPEQVIVGSSVLVTITITNTGEEDLQDITVVDSVLGDLSGFFSDTLAQGASETQSISVPTSEVKTVTNTVTVTGTGVTSTATATASATCTTEIAPPGPSPSPTLPPTGFSGAGGPSAVWLFVMALGGLLAGGWVRYAARNRN